MRKTLTLLFAVMLPAHTALAQDSAPWLRTGRVVLYSPHHDLIPLPYGGTDCPAQPLRAYGFETTAHGGTSTLQIRLFGPGDARAGKLPGLMPGEAIRLSRRWQGTRFVDLAPKPPWLVDTDGEGRATLHVPPGVYELGVAYGMPLGRAVVQVRPGTHDSLQVYVTPRALC